MTEKEYKIDITDIPSIFQLSIMQDTQAETIEQMIFEIKKNNDQMEKLSKIVYEQSKLLESLYERVEKYENSRDRLRKTER